MQRHSNVGQAYNRKSMGRRIYFLLQTTGIASPLAPLPPQIRCNGSSRAQSSNKNLRMNMSLKRSLVLFSSDFIGVLGDSVECSRKSYGLALTDLGLDRLEQTIQVFTVSGVSKY